jgi:hypothetical protein
VALWVDANRAAHGAFVAVVENKTIPGVSTADGNVTLDVSGILRDVGKEVGLPAAALARIPPDAGKFMVLRSNQLSLVQKGVRTIKAMTIWLVVLLFFLWGFALYFAAGARRAAVRDIGWSLFVVGVLLLLVRHGLGNYVVHALTTAQTKPAGSAVWAIETGILGEIGWAVLVYGLAIVCGAILAGPTRVGKDIRSWVAPLLNSRPVLASGLVAFAYVLLVAWGPTHALRTWYGILILGALIALGTYVLRRQTLAEFPADAVPHGTSQIAAAGAALKAFRPNHRARHERHSVGAEIEQLQGLKASGAISEDDYQRAKEKVLA